MFASLLEFFTHDWNISLPNLYAAEWGVFAALKFKLTTKPSDVAFHFKRLMKALGTDPAMYLGATMYGYWQQSLTEEEIQRQERDSRVENQRKRKEEKKLEQLERGLRAAKLAANSSDRASIYSSDPIADNDTKLNGETQVIVLNEINEEIHSKTITMRRRQGIGDLFKMRRVGTQGKRSRSTDGLRSGNTLLIKDIDTVNEKGNGVKRIASSEFYR